MAQFTPKPPVYEARPYEGGQMSTTDIQGWLLANGVESVHSPGGPVDDLGDVPDEIEFDGKTLTAGRWLLHKDGEFKVMKASELFSQYTMVQ